MRASGEPDSVSVYLTAHPAAGRIGPGQRFKPTTFKVSLSGSKFGSDFGLAGIFLSVARPKSQCASHRDSGRERRAPRPAVGSRHRGTQAPARRAGRPPGRLAPCQAAARRSGRARPRGTPGGHRPAGPPRRADATGSDATTDGRRRPLAAAVDTVTLPLSGL